MKLNFLGEREYMMVDQEQLEALVDDNFPGAPMERSYVCLEDHWSGQEERESSQSLDEAWIRAQGGLRLQRVIATAKEICGRVWPLDLAIAEALDEHVLEDVGAIRSDRRVWRRMTMWAEGKVLDLRRARVSWIDRNSKVDVKAYTRAGSRADVRDGWSWLWQGRRRTVEGRPVALHEARSAPTDALMRGVMASPGPWAKEEDQTESDWWSAWSLIIVRVMKECKKMEKEEGRSAVRATLAVPEMLAITRMMVETGSVRMERIMTERDMELVLGCKAPGEGKRRRRGLWSPGWRANTRLEDDEEEAEDLQVFKWRQVKIGAQVVVTMAGPEDEYRDNE